ncbi:MAG: GGDEF domain-containing protein [Chloroflexota bacterium]|nr:GGDEF domain-containing protein [Dehalococcoidia bacterium]MDW8253324.1 GGDEF domain-containing protein [Chloroflexota bacterium]
MLRRFRFSRGPQPTAPPALSAAGTAPPESEEEPALDTVAAILRTLGTSNLPLAAPELADFPALCEAWAAHLLLRQPSPNAPDKPFSRRDWGGVRMFVLKSREQELDAVSRSLGDLRDALWKMIETFSQAFREDEGQDHAFHEQIDRLKSALDKNSTEELKREVLGAIASLRRIAEERQQQSRRRIERLSTTVALLTNDLRTAKREAQLDGLTRIHNRAAFDDYIATTIQLQRSFPRPTTLLLIDIDHFKQINDTFGHQAGDAVLQTFVGRLALAFPRRSDFLARYGGDEFAVILPDTSLEDAIPLAIRHIEDLRRHEIDCGENKVRVTVSVGLAELKPNEDGASWIGRADKALYAAKREGRDRFVVAGP